MSKLVRTLLMLDGCKNLKKKNLQFPKKALNKSTDVKEN